MKARRCGYYGVIILAVTARYNDAETNSLRKVNRLEISSGQRDRRGKMRELSTLQSLQSLHHPGPKKHNKNVFAKSNDLFMLLAGDEELITHNTETIDVPEIDKTKLISDADIDAPRGGKKETPKRKPRHFNLHPISDLDADMPESNKEEIPKKNPRHYNFYHLSDILDSSDSSSSSSKDGSSSTYSPSPSATLDCIETFSPSPSLFFTESPYPTHTAFPTAPQLFKFPPISLSSSSDSSSSKSKSSKGKKGKSKKKKKGKMYKKSKKGSKSSKGKGKGYIYCSEPPASTPSPTKTTISQSPAPTIIPTTVTNDVSFTVAPTGQPSSDGCEATSGLCVTTADELRAELDSAAAGNVIEICDNTVLETQSVIEISQDQITLCCTQCTMKSTFGNDTNIFVQGKSITLQGIRFEDGTSDQFNGGNVNIQADGDHVISGCEFVNGATGEVGGNLFVHALGGTLTILNSSFINGVAELVGGGAAVLDASEITITNSEFINNNAQEGGGFYSVVNTTSNDFSQVLTISGSNFTDNTANVGGGFLVSEMGSLPSLRIVSSDFSTNSAAQAAGAGGILDAVDQGDFSLEKNTGSNNTAAIICEDFLTFATDADIPDNPQCIGVSDVFP